MAPVLKILGVPSKRGTMPKIWRPVAIFVNARKCGCTPRDRSLLWDWALLRKVISDFGGGGGGRVTSGRRSESLLITPNAFEPKYSNC